MVSLPFLKLENWLISWGIPSTASHYRTMQTVCQLVAQILLFVFQTGTDSKQAVAQLKILPINFFMVYLLFQVNWRTSARVQRAYLQGSNYVNNDLVPQVSSLTFFILLLICFQHLPWNLPIFSNLVPFSSVLRVRSVFVLCAVFQDGLLLDEH